MKIMLHVMLMMCLSLSASAQIGLDYLGYSNGFYSVKVTSSSACKEIRISWQKGGLPNDTVVTLVSSSMIVQLPSSTFESSAQIKAKPGDQCPVEGWTTVKINSTTLPIKVEQLIGKPLGAFNRILWKVTDAKDYKVELQSSLDGITWKSVMKIHNEVECLDGGASSPITYYRLYIVYKDIGYTTSKVIRVDNDLLDKKVYLFNTYGQYVGEFPRGGKLPGGLFILNHKLTYIQ